ncbi:MAG: hypothetical protein OXQ92_04330 [Boseongicola sp.]|nr:hypothetical protein [Boseongicola sp.]MDD9976786.1 hypothetical protein [Boseongicola sp.]
MPEPAIPPEDFQSLDQLMDKLPNILAQAPKETGTLDMIVMRPEPEARVLPQTFDVSAELGVNGDHWKGGSGYALDDGSGDPDAQICMMMSGCIGAIAGDISNWAPAGDNFFLDMDLTPSNMPPGTKFAIGTAEFVVTEMPHNGCQKFIDRYGRDACLFVNTGKGKELRLRGIYARVTRDGTVSVGDTVHKL